MSEYNVKQISEMLDTNPETVRRWIRSGKLEAEQTSKKGGNVVSEEALKKFLQSTPKYASLLAGAAIAATPVMGLPMAMGAIIGGIAGGFYQRKNHTVTPEYIKEHIASEIKKSKKLIKQKEVAIAQMQLELDNEKKNIQELTYLLQNGDFDQMALDINTKEKK